MTKIPDHRVKVEVMHFINFKNKKAFDGVSSLQVVYLMLIWEAFMLTLEEMPAVIIMDNQTYSLLDKAVAMEVVYKNVFQQNATIVNIYSSEGSHVGSINLGNLLNVGLGQSTSNSGHGNSGGSNSGGLLHVSVGNGGNKRTMFY